MLGVLEDCLHFLQSIVESPQILYRNRNGVRLSHSGKEETVQYIPPQEGIVFFGTRNGLQVEYATNSTQGPQITKELSNWAKQINAKELHTKAPAKKNQEEIFTTPFQINPTEVPLEDKLELLRKSHKKITQMDSSVHQAQCIYQDEKIEETFLSLEKKLQQTLYRQDSIYSLIMANHHHKVQIWDGHSLAKGFENSEILEDKIACLIKDGHKLLKAETLAPGEYECIVSPSVSGMIAHEAFGHGAEADLFPHQRSRGIDYLGKEVASPLVSLVDNPLASKQTSLYYFDHYGELSKPTQIIDKGILKTPLSDKRTSQLTGQAITSSGRRENVFHKTYTRMSNTYFLPGSSNLEEMIQSTQKGILLHYPVSGMEDPKGWGMQIELLLGEEILKGKRTGRFFSPIIMTGYVPEILKSVSMVSKESEYNTLGMCGKGYKEWVKVHDGGPWMKLQARLG